MLEKLADGERLLEQDLLALRDFNQFEWQVRSALLCLDVSFARSTFSIQEINVLREIAKSKFEVRDDLKKALNRNLTMGRRINHIQARTLLDRVTELNAVIEEFDQALQTLMRGQPW